MKTGIKSIEISDFDEIREEVEQLQWLTKEFRVQCGDVRIDSTDTIGHPMRMWEWGRVLKNFKEHFGYPFYGKEINVLDVGTAVSLIGPALSYLGCRVVECDVDASFQPERLKLKKFLDNFPPAIGFEWVQAGFGTLKERCVPRSKEKYDAVMSISTIEHVETSLEKNAWKEMFDLLKPGGLMIVTMDCFPVAKKGYIYDDVRYTNYDMNLVKERVDELKSYGMKTVGGEDYRYHGIFVDDGSFSCIHMVKK